MCWIWQTSRTKRCLQTCWNLTSIFFISTILFISTFFLNLLIIIRAKSIGDWINRMDDHNHVDALQVSYNREKGTSLSVKVWLRRYDSSFRSLRLQMVKRHPKHQKMTGEKQKLWLALIVFSEIVQRIWATAVGKKRSFERQSLEYCFDQQTSK